MYSILLMSKEGQAQPLRLKDLPKKLQQKYRNSIVFEKENKCAFKKFEFDAEKLKKRKIDKEKTLEQKMDEFTIDKTEEKYLFKVFEKLTKGAESFGREEIAEVLKKMEMEMTKSEIELMIWEFDEDLDKRISQKQFIAMYKKCMMDKAAAEPKKLFHLAQFLMYCQEGNYRVTVEDTLELLFVRAQNEAKCERRAKDIFEDEIKIIFGQDYETQEDGVEKEITFKEYLQKINKKAIEKRKREIEKIKTQLKYN